MERQNIVTVIVDILKKINKENGFYSNAGENCFEWYEKPLSKDDYPAIIVRDTEDNANTSAGSWDHNLRIEMDILTNGKKSIWNTREIISDVLKSFKEVEETINYSCSYKGSETLLEQADYAYGGTRVVFIVTYQTAPWEQ